MSWSLNETGIILLVGGTGKAILRIGWSLRAGVYLVLIEVEVRPRAGQMTAARKRNSAICREDVEVCCACLSAGSLKRRLDFDHARLMLRDCTPWE